MPHDSAAVGVEDGCLWWRLVEAPSDGGLTFSGAGWQLAPAGRNTKKHKDDRKDDELRKAAVLAEQEDLSTYFPCIFTAIYVWWASSYSLAK